MLHKNSSRGLALAAVFFALFGAADRAQAQQNSLFGSNGPMNGSAGLSTGSMGGTGSMSTSSAGMQSTGFPMSAFPATTFPGPGMNAMGGNQGMMGGQMGGQGMNGQQQTFIGATNGPLVGMNRTGQNQNGMNRNNRQGQNRNQGIRRPGQNANQTNQTGAAGANQQRTIRPQLVVAFNPPRATVDKATNTLSTRFDKLSSRTGLEGVTIASDEGRVVLRGEVDSASTSRLAAMLARMEPGVRSVKNELTVKGPPSAE